MQTTYEFDFAKLSTIVGSIREGFYDSASYLEKWVSNTCAFVNGENKCNGIGEYFQWTLDNGLALTMNIIPLTAMLAITLVILAMMTRIWLLFAYMTKKTLWSFGKLTSLVLMACIHVAMVVCDTALNSTQTVRGCLRVIAGDTA